MGEQRREYVCVSSSLTYSNRLPVSLCVYPYHDIELVRTQLESKRKALRFHKKVYFLKNTLLLVGAVKVRKSILHLLLTM